MNPSTADEVQLDPTLRRIKDFSSKLGANEFLMLNIFAYRATDPADMKAAADPVGPDNDKVILESIAEAATLTTPLQVIAGWGNHGTHLDRERQVLELIRPAIRNVGGHLLCLGRNQNGSPKHPLYIKGDSPFLSIES